MLAPNTVVGGRVIFPENVFTEAFGASDVIEVTNGVSSVICTHSFSSIGVERNPRVLLLLVGGDGTKLSSIVSGFLGFLVAAAP
jgi:hypothetical protein